MMGGKLGRQGLAIERRNVARLREGEALGQIAYVREGEPPAPARLAKHLVEPLVDIESLHRVIAPMMGYKAQRALPAPWTKLHGVEQARIRAISDHEPRRTQI